MRHLITLLITLLAVESFSQSCNVTNCSACDPTNTFCQECVDTYVLVNNTFCLDSSLLNCGSLNATTPGYNNFQGCYVCVGANISIIMNYANTNLTGCGICPVDNCNMCNTNMTDVCYYCDTPYFKSNNSYCYNSIDLNCEYLGYNYKGCIACNPGADLNGTFPGTNLTYCANCSLPNCGFCPDNLTTCMSCLSGYFFANSSYCASNEEFNCYGSTDYEGCVSCISYEYGLMPNYSGNLTGCVPCYSDNCSYCANNYLQCNQCDNDYMLYNTSSNQSLCLNCDTLNCPGYCSNGEGCTYCVDGFYTTTQQINGTKLTSCSMCPTNCTTCGSATNCTSCEPNFVLKNVTNGSVEQQSCVVFTQYSIRVHVQILMSLILLIFVVFI